MNKFVYFNDTNKFVTIHPATRTHGCECDMSKIDPQTIREFELPEGTYAWVKMWDNGSHFQILVSPHSYDEKPVVHEPMDGKRLEEFIERFPNVYAKHFAKQNPHDKKEEK